MVKGIWRRVGDCAIPVGPESIEYFQALKDGREFLAETHGARNIKQLRMWWVLCQLVADNDTEYQTRTQASNGLKIALKHVETFLDREGRLHIWPASIAFESLTQEDFNPLFKAAIEKVSEWLGSSPREVQDHFNEIIADKRYEGYRR